MRILFLTTTFAAFSGDPLGGIGNSFYDLLYELSKSATVDVVAPLAPNSSKEQKVNNLTIYRVSPAKNYGGLQTMFKSFYGVKIPIMLINMYFKARNLVQLNNYDIIHGFFIFPSGFLISMLPTKSLKIITAWGSDVHTLSKKPLMPSLYRFIFSKTNGVIYNTPSMRKRLNDLRAKNLNYIPTPFQSSSFKLSKKLPESLDFIFVGRLTKEKGIEILLGAFKKVFIALPESRLVIVGDGPEKKWIKNFIEQNNLNDSVYLAGTLERKEIVRHLKNSRALLLPSFGEGTPASVLEAMAVGRPVVATKVGDLENLIDDESGILTKVGDVDEFTNGIIKIYKKNYKPERISAKTKKFDARLIAKEYFDFYRGLKKIR